MAGPVSCLIDHLVVTAPTLDIGAAFIRQNLGVSPQPGGEHTRMGTHNLLLRLGDMLYLEVIATNPAAAAPARARWFGLDDLSTDSPARLATWVASTTDIDACAARSSEGLGAIEQMSRGERTWQITIPPDGVPPLGGIAPALIEWATPDHPAASLQEHGLSLASLTLLHPQPERIGKLIASLALNGPVKVERLTGNRSPFLVAGIDTPAGMRMLPLHRGAASA